MFPGNFCNMSLSEIKWEKDLFEAVCTEESIGFLVYYCGLLITITVVNLIGNSLVISTILRCPGLQHPCNYYLVSLAVSDLMAGFFYTIYNLSHQESFGIREFVGNWAICRFLVLIVHGFLFTSGFHVVAITAARYIVIVKALNSEQYLTVPRVTISLAAIWSCSWSLAAILNMTFTPAASYPGICRYELIFTLWHIVGAMIIATLVPLLIMICLYIRITSIARRQAKVIAALETLSVRATESDRKQALNRARKSTKMVAMLLGFFTMGWTPFCLFGIVSLACESYEVSEYIRASARLLLHMNTAVNIFIYAGRLGDFRTALKKDITKMLQFLRIRC